MQPNGLPTCSELEIEIERLHRVISGGIDIATAHGMQILDLQRRIIEQNATIARQAAQLEQYAKMIDDERATVSVLRESIVQLRAQLSQRSVTLARYKHAYQAEKNMFEDCETLRQAEMATIAQLRAQLAAVPVNSIRRYYAFTHYDVHAVNDAGYTTQQFDSDDMWIGMWLESLDGDA